MNRILLVDIDSTIPNIPLMKLATYYKGEGREVVLVKCHIPYYPNKKIAKIETTGYSQVFVSAIFQETLSHVSFDCHTPITFGGTGYNLETILPENIESLECDYSLYPENNISYGFLTRGCIRNCYFCVVPKKEGSLHKVAEVSDIVRHNKVKFLDNNILAYSGCKIILKELRGLKVSFNQGLDIRFLTEEIAILLEELNYLGEYIFAFDNLRTEKNINKKLSILKKHFRSWGVKFFLYCNPKMSIEQDVWYRIEYCKRNKILPYLMRDRACWGNPNQDVYTDLAAYCNQPGIFKNMTFKDFLLKRHVRKNGINYRRVENSLIAVGGNL